MVYLIQRMQTAWQAFKSGLSRFVAPDYLRDPTWDDVPRIEVIEVDWTQAPLDAVTWKYSAKPKQGRWLNGKNRIEEYGCVWEWTPAPSFGATQEATVNIDELGRAKRAAAYQARELDAATPATRVNDEPLPTLRPTRRL